MKLIKREAIFPCYLAGLCIATYSKSGLAMAGLSLVALVCAFWLED